ncbi:MAG: acetyltransferase [Legionella sp.]|nr:MAG: acetyltransferase [Legionella sp.]
MSDIKRKPIVIEGRTAQGTKFRPSDWAERMSGSLASFKNSRIRYSPLLQPGINNDGLPCVIVDPKLKESSPQLYQSILDFAKANHLNICNEN